MKILSFTAPWATLIALGAKEIETRSWRTSYRGPLAIHQAKGMASIGGKAGFEDICRGEHYERVLTEYMRSLPEQSLNAYWSAIPLGVIVAVVDLVACRYTQGEYGSMPAPWIAGLSEQEKAFGNYDANRYGWFLKNIQKLKDPIPCKGAQGLRDLPPDIEARVREQLNTQ